MVNYCCVPNCPSNGKSVTMHVFPRDEELFKKWLDKIDNNDLLKKPFEVVRKNRRICDMHFSMELRYQKSGTTGLKATAVPNLHLNLPKGFSKYSEVQLLGVRNPKQQDDDGNDVQQGVSSNSGKAPIEDSARASTPKAGESEIDPITKFVPQLKRDSILARVNVTQKKKFQSVHAQKLYELALRYKRSARRYQKLSNKTRITNALKLSITEKFVKASVNDASYTFFYESVGKSEEKEDWASIYLG
nr:52 kDa repressor of the inhibitor of the protein kinase-like [Onthophagus taurus]